jgi:tetratricopeptide (TPR) repeat protein
VTQTKPEKAMAYSFKFKNLIDDNDHSKHVTHFVPRLYPNGLNICYKNIVHEQLIDRHNNNVPAVYLPDVHVLHYGYLPSVMKEREKHSRNLDMIHRSIKVDKENPFHYFNLGTTYRSAGDNEKAVDAFRAVLRLADSSFDQYHYYQSSWVYLASCLLDMGMCAEAANVCLYVPETVHDIPDFWCVFGGSMLGLGHILAAKIALEKCISMEQNTTVSISDRTCFDRAKKWLESKQLQ